MNGHTPRRGIFNYLTGRAICNVPRSAEEAEGLLDSFRDDVLREWAVIIREVGTAKGWSTWAGPFIDPDVEFVDTSMPPTKTIVAELRRLDRAAVLREAAAAIDLPPGCNCGGCTAVRGMANKLRRMAAEGEKDTSGGRQPTEGESTPDAGPQDEPLIVSRYDVAMEPALEEAPVLAVGAVAEDGRPVALLFDPEARRKVAGWLAPAHASVLPAAHLEATARDASYATDTEGPSQ
ncbi:hypothetical protein OG352_05355 [Streptomyces sp. NBC_01485]|uniref:hypothetical protein n=1 Tax=Streptomyces sp. NBC_01485 TaxID=2903884 RepID=UPI002E351A92|nr:hypothetical protein [Streptomyces sp. NBC_01485]